MLNTRCGSGLLCLLRCQVFRPALRLCLDTAGGLAVGERLHTVPLQHLNSSEPKLSLNLTTVSVIIERHKTVTLNTTHEALVLSFGWHYCGI